MASPCSRRAAISIAGDSQPACANVGTTAIIRLPAAIRKIVAASAFLRPWRSV